MSTTINKEEIQSFQECRWIDVNENLNLYTCLTL